MALNGNGVMMNLMPPGCPIVYASDPANSCREGSMATYRKRSPLTKMGGV